MKRALAVRAVALFSTTAAVHAQDNTKTDSRRAVTVKAAPARATQASSSRTTGPEFRMVGGNMMHCTGGKQELLTHDVTLQNGSVLNAKGELVSRTGTKTTLHNGQGVDMNGRISPGVMLHAGVKKGRSVQKK